MKRNRKIVRENLFTVENLTIGMKLINLIQFETRASRAKFNESKRCGDGKIAKSESSFACFVTETQLVEGLHAL